MGELGTDFRIHDIADHQHPVRCGSLSEIGKTLVRNQDIEQNVGIERVQHTGQSCPSELAANIVHEFVDGRFVRGRVTLLCKAPGTFAAPLADTELYGSLFQNNRSVHYFEFDPRVRVDTELLAEKDSGRRGFHANSKKPGQPRRATRLFFLTGS